MMAAACALRRRKKTRAPRHLLSSEFHVRVYYYLTLGARPGIFQHHEFSLCWCERSTGDLSLLKHSSLHFKETAQELHSFLWSYPTRFYDSDKKHALMFKFFSKTFLPIFKKKIPACLCITHTLLA
jgi:hypothetical protein